MPVPSMYHSHAPDRVEAAMDSPGMSTSSVWLARSLPAASSAIAVMLRRPVLEKEYCTVKFAAASALRPSSQASSAT